MARFGQLLITEELNGRDIHRLDNIITMASDKHDAFDKLQLWFEETVRRPLLLIWIP
jgi:HNH endonuclease